MRSLLLVGPYPPPFGGPGVHMLHLRRQLAALGVKCSVLNIGPGRRESRPDVLPMRSASDFVLTILRWSKQGSHVHHFYNVESYRAIVLAVVAASLTRFGGGSYSVGFIGGPHQRHLRRSFWGWVNRFALGSAEFIICNNESVQAALIRAGANRRKVHPIESFHPEQLTHIGDLPPAVAEYLETHDPIVASVVHPRFETEEPHHEMQTLLPALRRLREHFPSLGCVVVGGSNHVGHYRRLAADQGLSEQVLFTGELPHEQCLAVISRSSVFVRAYVKDGNSSSVREALALGVPTVASANPQHPGDVIQFPPAEGAALAKALEDAFMRLGELRHRLSPRQYGSDDADHAKELALLMGRGSGAGRVSDVAPTAASDLSR